ncbi:hypothetical protein [Salinibacter ruber]|uniref:hypothetical protein n=1 Tax=Salinibacter ruber TaxID=146919 RepID=UPI002167149E|nr:hypothetical protein [Salinibacter ruber]MCS3698401.1 hypothetical protein [Salinibacter ruber]
MDDASPKTDATLEDLPELKADLEEARRFISRLEDRKEETDSHRYERVRQRYERQIEELEPTVRKLIDQGKSRKQELEDSLADHQEKAQKAEAELQEIEQLHEEGAMNKESYQEDRRRLRQQKKKAEKKASRLERKLDEVKFYLTETGNVSYKKKQSMDSGPTFSKQLQVWLGSQEGLLGSWFVWGGCLIALLVGVLYWALGGFLPKYAFGYPEADYRAPQHNLGLSREKIRMKNSGKAKIFDKSQEGVWGIKWKFVPKNKEAIIYEETAKVYIEEHVSIKNKEVVSSSTTFYFEKKEMSSEVFKEKSKLINEGTRVSPEFKCGNFINNRLPNGECGALEWKREKETITLDYSGYEDMKKFDMTAFMNSYLER